MRTAAFLTGLFVAFWYIAAPGHEGALEPLGGGKYQLVYPDAPAPPAPPPEPPSVEACPSTPGAINWYVAVDGNDSNDGTCEKPFRHIQQIFDASRDATRAVHGWVQGGTYPRETARNRESYPHGLTVQCWPGEQCTLDGEHRTSLAYLYSDSPGECQNVTLDGLTLHRYINWGIRVSDPLYRDERDRRDQNWQGCNRFLNITITKLGGDWGCGDFGGTCKGYGGITGQNADNNLVENLTCERLQNSGNGGGIHCVYWSNGSSDNVVKGSTCTKSTSACYKTRDDSRRNEFIDITCKDSDLCFYSGMPSGRPEEKQDRDVVIKNMVRKNTDKWECRLKASGDRSSSNCNQVVVSSGSGTPSKPDNPDPSGGDDKGEPNSSERIKWCDRKHDGGLSDAQKRSECYSEK